MYQFLLSWSSQKKITCACLYHAGEKKSQNLCTILCYRSTVGDELKNNILKLVRELLPTFWYFNFYRAICLVVKSGRTGFPMTPVSTWNYEECFDICSPIVFLCSSVFYIAAHNTLLSTFGRLVCYGFSCILCSRYYDNTIP